MKLALANGIGDINPDAPTRAVNALSQTIVTCVTWTAVLVIVVVAVRMARKRATAVPVMMVIAALVQSLNEPLWDDAFHLFWYRPGQWTWLSSFGYPQPVWLPSTYVIVYCVPGLILLSKLERGASRQWLYRAFGGVFLFFAAFETLATSIGLYAYFGPQPFRVLTDYPLWMAGLEACHVLVWAILLAKVGPLLSGWRSLFVVPLFSVSFCSIMFGAGMPALAAINSNSVGTGLRYGAVLITFGLAASIIRVFAQLLPSAKAAGRFDQQVRLFLATATAPAPAPAPAPADLDPPAVSPLPHGALV